MKKALLYFVLYRLLDVESVLWSMTDAVRGTRERVAAKLHAIIHSS